MSGERHSPALPQVLLLAAFLLLTGVGIFTVIVPELWDDAEETEEGEGSEEESPEDEPEDEPAE